ncbi:hypothetical protein KC19_6G184700 [Ceratodon purpureus]|uniref:Fungal lipase-like domain-containing protein n=1 Tax=Ceratodon purpureus TaxID=3225 RepID=A0A8T0HG58_CERPU|nr:hypothetical protein KC19_6G184700 [Ceratodon purpureus]
MEGPFRLQAAGLDPHDLCRAFACSLAVSRKDVFRSYSDAFTLDPKRQFEEVYFSPPQEEQQFIVAHAKDAVFIAFLGSKVLEDYACDMMIDKIRRGLGSYHRGIYYRSSCFLGLLGGKILYSLVDGLILQKKRIIFCGHSLGGAVGHMVLTRLLFEDELGFFREESKTCMLSIAFGAPHFCDKVAAAAIENCSPVQFFNFVNGRDPVPRLLHDLPLTIRKAASKIKDSVQFRTGIQVVGTLAGDLLHFFATGKVDVDLDTRDEVPVCELVCKSWEEVKKKASDAEEKRSVYAPIGTFVFLERNFGIVEVIHSTSEAIGGRLYDLSLEDVCFDDHKCGSYLRAFLDNSLIEAVNSCQNVRGFFHKASSRQPEVATAECRAHDGGGSAGSSFLRITGKNLFLLREVAWNNVRIEATEVVRSSFGEMQIFHPLSHEESNKMKSSTTSPGSTLFVRTAFGECYSSVVEEHHRGHSKGVNYLLRKLVPDLLLLASLGIRPSKEEVDCLEMILRNFGGMSSNMSLETLLTSGGVDKAEVAIKIADAAASNIVKPLVLEFRKGNDAEGIEVLGCTIDSALNGVGRTLVAVAIGASPAVVGAPAVGAVGATVLGSVTGVISIAQTSLVWLYSMTGWIAFGAYDRLDPIVKKLVWKWSMSSFDDFLKVAVEEARLRNGKPPSGNNRQSYTEGDLVKEVNGAPGSIDELKAAFSDDGKYWQRPTLSTKNLSTATDECTRLFLRKMYAIVETRNLYERYLSDKFFVAVVGLEDVGKTSFIQGVVPKLVTEDEVGIDVHTQEVTPYILENGLILVDFPGFNGMSGEFERWFKAFTAMPSIIVLLLNFEHDIKQDQVDQYELFRNRISSPILAVFNKVDKHVERRTMKKYTEKYFSELRNKYAVELKCISDCVVFASLSPDEEKAEAVKSLIKAGVVDLKGFMQKLQGFRQEMRNSFKV